MDGIFNVDSINSVRFNTINIRHSSRKKIVVVNFPVNIFDFMCLCFERNGVIIRHSIKLFCNKSNTYIGLNDVFSYFRPSTYTIRTNSPLHYLKLEIPNYQRGEIKLYQCNGNGVEVNDKRDSLVGLSSIVHKGIAGRKGGRYDEDVFKLSVKSVESTVNKKGQKGNVGEVFSPSTFSTKNVRRKVTRGRKGKRGKPYDTKNVLVNSKNTGTNRLYKGNHGRVGNAGVQNTLRTRGAFNVVRKGRKGMNASVTNSVLAIKLKYKRLKTTKNVLQKGRKGSSSVHTMYSVLNKKWRRSDGNKKQYLLKGYDGNKGDKWMVPDWGKRKKFKYYKVLEKGIRGSFGDNYVALKITSVDYDKVDVLNKGGRGKVGRIFNIPQSKLNTPSLHEYKRTRMTKGVRGDVGESFTFVRLKKVVLYREKTVLNKGRRGTVNNRTFKSLLLNRYVLNISQNVVLQNGRKGLDGERYNVNNTVVRENDKKRKHVVLEKGVKGNASYLMSSILMHFDSDGIKKYKRTVVEKGRRGIKGDASATTSSSEKERKNKIKREHVYIGTRKNVVVDKGHTGDKEKSTSTNSSGGGTAHSTTKTHRRIVLVKGRKGANNVETNIVGIYTNLYYSEYVHEEFVREGWLHNPVALIKGARGERGGLFKHVGNKLVNEHESLKIHKPRALLKGQKGDSSIETNIVQIYTNLYYSEYTEEEFVRERWF